MTDYKKELLNIFENVDENIKVLTLNMIDEYLFVSLFVKRLISFLAMS